MFKRLLVPLDGSRFSTRALPYAIEVAQRFNAPVILIQVVTPATPVPLIVAPGVESSIVTAITAEETRRQDKGNLARAKQYLSRKVREITSQGIKGSYRVIVGDPAGSIMRFCQQEHVDLVIMTTHGKSGLKRAIMGSVADEVIRGSKIPVLVIRPQLRSKK